MTPEGEILADPPWTERNRKFDVILADPPWQYRNKRTGGSMKSGAAQKYSTLTPQRIAQMGTDIRRITAKDCVLFLWGMVPLLDEIYPVVEAWGFEYKTTIFWRKINSLGLGFWFRGQVEVCLFAKRGKVKAFRCQRPNFIQSKARKHSQKPEEFFDLIEPVLDEQSLDRRIELFAREKRPGWSAWGNEIESDISLEVTE